MNGPRNEQGLAYAVWEPEDRPEGCPFEPGRFLLGVPGRSDTAAGLAEADLDEGFGGSVPFGKHKGRPWSEVPASYLRWMVGNVGNKKWRRLAELELERRA